MKGIGNSWGWEGSQSPKTLRKGMKLTVIGISRGETLEKSLQQARYGLFMELHNYMQSLVYL